MAPFILITADFIQNLLDSVEILFLESFYGGSHKEFADGFCEHSTHSVDLVTLPDRFWKWRMRGASLAFAEKVKDPGKYDGIVVSDLINIADLKALWGNFQCPPIVLYFHENQLSYPAWKARSRDAHFGFTDFMNALTADKILFNSNFHLQEFFKSLSVFLKRLPDFRPLSHLEELMKKCQTLHLGCRIPGSQDKIATMKTPGEDPLIIWNHRWEYDKQPEVFFNGLYKALDKGMHFRVACLGENPQTLPQEFVKAKRILKERIIHYGYAPKRSEYLKWLKRGDIVASTAIQENFGIAMVEAIRFGCRPLLPRRLSYPEIIPSECHEDIFYDNDDDFSDRLMAVIEEYHHNDGSLTLPGLAESMGRFSWPSMIDNYDSLLLEFFKANSNH